MIMHVGNHNLQFSYTIDGQAQMKLLNTKKLGMVFDHMLKFHSHVSTLVLKVNRTLGMIKKCFTSLNQSTLFFFA